MCGIASIVGPAADENLLRTMVAPIAHRGDLTEVACVDSAAVGTRRLPIVDRAHAVQPWIIGQDSTPNSQPRRLTYNGEVYNCGDLRAELIADGCTFTTASDTEVVAVAFGEWGENAAGRLRGEFAYAVADPDGRRTYVARDPVGVKPLYYAHTRASMFVASEIKALTFLDAVIHAVPPGHHGWLHADGRTEITPYHRPRAAPSSPEFTDVDAAAVAVRTCVVDAIRVRLDTDLPVAVILSGGLDSTIVACVAAEMCSDVTAFTIGSGSSPDVEYAARVAHDLGMQHVVVEVDPRTMTANEVRSAIASSELTEYGDVINAVISHRLFAAIASRGIKVAIGGDGSDELFGGYAMYADADVDTVGDLFAHKLSQLHRTELQRTDRASMANGVEVRVPFLDPLVIDTAVRVPPRYKTRDGVDKWILRQAFSNLVPRYVLERPKHGLSYSSGLHDRVRLFKVLHANTYGRLRYTLHAPVRRDFDAALRRAGGDLSALLAAGGETQSDSRRELLTDFVGAVRWNVEPPLRKALRALPDRFARQGR